MIFFLLDPAGGSECVKLKMTRRDHAEQLMKTACSGDLMDLTCLIFKRCVVTPFTPVGLDFVGDVVKTYELDKINPK